MLLINKHTIPHVIQVLYSSGSCLFFPHSNKKHYILPLFFLLTIQNLCFSCALLSHSVMSDSLQPYGLWPVRLLCPWDSPCKNIGVGCHAPSRGYSQSRDGTQGCHTAGKFFTTYATREAQASAVLVYFSLKFLLLLSLSTTPHPQQ